MRKRSLFEFFDWLLWTFIGLLPFIYALIVIVAKTEGAPTIYNINDALNNFFSTYQLGVNNNMIYKVLEGMFISGNYGITLGNSAFFKAIAFFGTVQIVHFVLDVVLFIPRLAMRLCDKFSK